MSAHAVDPVLLQEGELAYEALSLAFRRWWLVCAVRGVVGLLAHTQAPPGGIDGDFVATAAGSHHSLALRRDGGIACWGRNIHGQAPPEGVDGDFIAVASHAPGSVG